MFERGGYMAGYFPSKDQEGRDFLLLVVKRTFDIDLVEGKCKPADQQAELVLGDEYHGKEDPFASSIRYESDLAPWKTKKDIVFLGSAHAPGGKESPSWDVTLKVGAWERTLRVFGPRKVQWIPPREEGKGKTKTLEPQPPVIGDPEPIAEVELIYENAYGGFATYYPPDPDAFRKAVATEQKKTKEKKEVEEKKAAEELAKQEAAEEKKAAATSRKEEEIRKKGYFYHGVKRADEEPDVAFEIELGSRKLKAHDGTMVLDVAELAEAEAREAAEAAREAKAKTAAELDPLSERGTLIANIGELADVAAVLTEEADDERLAFQRQQALEAGSAESHTRVIKLADVGDEVTADDSWIQEQKREREDFYDGLGMDQTKAVAWEEGDFPRLPCPTNFVGKGFALGHSKQALDGLVMPQVEDPGALLKPLDLPVDPATLHLPTLPRPAGLGFINRSWVPRSYLAGLRPSEIEAAQHAMDQRLLEDFDSESDDDQLAIDALLDRAPQELQPAYYNAASPALQVAHLDGDELVHLTHLDAAGKTFFTLPGRRPEVRFDRGEGWEPVDVDLDTLVIDRPSETVTMVWRGRAPLSGLDELDDWPRADIDVHDWTVEEWRDKRHEAEIAAALLVKGAALVLGKDEVSDEEGAAFDQPIEAADTGLGGTKEESGTELREERAEDGALRDLQDREDVVLSDGVWVKETQDAQLSEEERLAQQEERDDRLRVRNAKEALRKKREADKKAKAEAEAKAAEQAKQKKSKKKKPGDATPPPKDGDVEE
ncbi:MAG: hypothetical protein ACI9WU_001078 [Myxococcota bacterium]|jgi:hypothetical protein